ncbi:hypothetical protein [Phaffia rhodozyma]|uniref:Uncharacterized protein n=1 Tax=Phaffia rhodozyma TaxID=264483 RepID=A0A0F7SGS9_PHARH|nr:hypothetical protein [Phaffia rhodozyma]
MQYDGGMPLLQSGFCAISVYENHSKDLEQQAGLTISSSDDLSWRNLHTTGTNDRHRQEASSDIYIQLYALTDYKPDASRSVAQLVICRDEHALSVHNYDPDE